jgi:hypothetical protein
MDKPNLIIEHSFLPNGATLYDALVLDVACVGAPDSDLRDIVKLLRPDLPGDADAPAPCSRRGAVGGAVILGGSSARGHPDRFPTSNSASSGTKRLPTRSVSRW